MQSHSNTNFDDQYSGWFQIGQSRRLKKGKIYPLSCLSTEFILFRSQNGIAHVWDAYCPHLGAHLGHGGRIVQDQIQCPFHGWEFEANTGQLAHVPFSEQKPRCQIREYTVVEKQGVILIYYPKKESHDSPFRQEHEDPFFWESWSTGLQSSLKLCATPDKILELLKQNNESIVPFWKEGHMTNFYEQKGDCPTRIFSSLVPVNDKWTILYLTLWTKKHSFSPLNRLFGRSLISKINSNVSGIML